LLHRSLIVGFGREFLGSNIADTNVATAATAACLRHCCFNRFLRYRKVEPLFWSFSADS
jgi:hypothetical protein